MTQGLPKVKGWERAGWIPNSGTPAFAFSNIHEVGMIDFRIADPLANSLCTSHRFPVIYRSTIRPPGALASPVYCHMLRPDCG
jgi:hypothetical protein